LAAGDEEDPAACTTVDAAGDSTSAPFVAVVSASGSSVELEGGDDPTDVVGPESLVELAEEPDGEFGAAPPVDDPPESESAEPPVSDDDDPESSARATPTCGPSDVKPNNAALTPAEAAPNCNQRRTPKFSVRRTGPLAERPPARVLAIY
jgi:hypothetical protein